MAMPMLPISDIKEISKLVKNLWKGECLKEGCDPGFANGSCFEGSAIETFIFTIKGA